MQIGCQTYSWEMLGHHWRGTPDDILDAVAGAGFAGVEFSRTMIGRYIHDPAGFERALHERGLRCAAFASGSPSGWSDPATADADLRAVEPALRFAAHFGVVLGLGSPASTTTDDLDRKFDHACRMLGVIARRARDYGVTVAVHPNSAPGSLVRSEAAYDRLLAATAADGVQFNPDTGHMARDGVPIIACLERHRDRIVHVHMKDVDRTGHWQPLGAGDSDVVSILGWLRDNYDDWLVIEDESDRVWTDLAGVLTDARRFVRDHTGQ